MNSLLSCGASLGLWSCNDGGFIEDLPTKLERKISEFWIRMSACARSRRISDSGLCCASLQSGEETRELVPFEQLSSVLLSWKSASGPPTDTLDSRSAKCWSLRERGIDDELKTFRCCSACNCCSNSAASLTMPEMPARSGLCDVPFSEFLRRLLSTSTVIFSLLSESLKDARSTAMCSLRLSCRSCPNAASF